MENRLGNKYYLPSKILRHLKRIQIDYTRADDKLKEEIILSSRVFVKENTSYDNWDGGSYGHTVYLYIPEELFFQIELSVQDKISSEITEDLNRCALNIPNEYYSDVHLELNDDADESYKRALPFSRQQPVDPDKLSIWKKGFIRLFISHRDKYKKEATLLADALETYGIASFVAHDTIEATKEWRKEIENGLKTMQAMLVFLTDDFADSPWTNQEVGFALGTGVPIVSLKLGKKSPPGFISHEQAHPGSLEAIEQSAEPIMQLVSKKLGCKVNLDDAAIHAFVESTNFKEAEKRFDIMEKVVSELNEAQVLIIINAYNEKYSLYSCYYLNSKYNRMVNFLNRVTGYEYMIDGNLIKKIGSSKDDDLPF